MPIYNLVTKPRLILILLPFQYNCFLFVDMTWCFLGAAEIVSHCIANKQIAFFQLHKGFDVLFSSTDNISFKQTNFPFFCASSCPSYLKSSCYEINMWSGPRSWPSSVAPTPAGRPAGRPMSERSRRSGRGQRCFTLRRFKRYPEFWKRL